MIHFRLFGNIIVLQFRKTQKRGAVSYTVNLTIGPSRVK